MAFANDSERLEAILLELRRLNNNTKLAIGVETKDADLAK